MSDRPTAAAFASAASRRKKPAATTTSIPVQRKYTVLLDEDLADSVDGALIRLRRDVGRKVDRSAVVRELLVMLTDDPTLARSVAERLAVKPS